MSPHTTKLKFRLKNLCRIRSIFVNSLNTRANYDLHIPPANLIVFQNRARYSGINIYNYLPPTSKQLSNDISKFKPALKRFLYSNYFYTLEEYYSWK